MCRRIASLVVLVISFMTGLVVCVPNARSQQDEAAALNRQVAEQKNAERLKKIVANKLGGGEKSYYSLVLVESKMDFDEVNSVIGFGALMLEMMAAPITILEGSQGNPDIRPGMFLENSPKVRPPSQSIHVEIATIHGKEQATAAVLQFLSSVPDPETNRDWKLVKRTSNKKAALAASDRLEQHFQQAAAQAPLTVVRRPDPKD